MQPRCRSRRQTETPPPPTRHHGNKQEARMGRVTASCRIRSRRGAHRVTSISPGVRSTEHQQDAGDLLPHGRPELPGGRGMNGVVPYPLSAKIIRSCLITRCPVDAPDSLDSRAHRPRAHLSNQIISQKLDESRHCSNVAVSQYIIT